MLKLVAKSKRGRKQLNRHGDVWIPVEANRQVGCLGGVPGIKLMSVKDRATFWIKVERDDNLIPVQRLDQFGRPIERASVVPANATTAEGEQLSATETPVSTAEAIKRQIDKYVINGGTLSGRTSASGGPNLSAIPQHYTSDAGGSDSEPDSLAQQPNADAGAPGVEVLLRAG